MRIWLIRHGESAMSGLYSGKRTNPSLSSRGREQADRLAVRFAAERVDRLYASPLNRAHQTAMAVSRICGRRIETVDGLAELDFGLWDGFGHDDLIRDFPEHYDAWLDDPEKTAPPEGERLSVMQRRVLAAFQIIRHAGSGNPAIVAHGGPIGVIICELLGLPLERRWQFRIETASITTVDWQDGELPVFIRVNEAV